MFMRKYVGRHCLGLLAVLVACWSFWPETLHHQASSESVSPVSDSKPVVGHLPIEQIRVGQRVVTYDSDPTVYATEVDPKTWKKLTLHAVDVWEDGTRDEHFIETLQPVEWILANGLVVGGAAPIPFDLQEMGGNEGLKATVTKIEECPAITPGSGRVVISTINHLNNHCCEVVLTDGDHSEAITATERHPFWSNSRQDWIKAINLESGEYVDALGRGHLRVQRVSKLTGTRRVYNMTVEADHVYRVGYVNCLVHNNYTRRDQNPGDMTLDTQDAA